MYASLLSRDLFSQLDDLQREVQSLFELAPNIRGVGRGSFPALNVGTTPGSVEMYAFAPGIDPKSIDLNLDRGVLTISGERRSNAVFGSENQQSDNGGGARNGERAIQHLSERFDGRFRRVVSLPDDIDPESVSADYRDGVLHISVKRRESAQPRRITIQ